MLALSPFALSYAPAFVARPVAVRSSAVMNHGMPPVYYDHDQEVHAHAPAMRPRFCMHNNPTLTLPFSRDDRASGTGREGTRRAWTAGLGRIGCERPCSGLLPSRSPHLALGLHLLPRAPATRTRNSWRIALSAPHTRAARPIFYDHDHEVRARNSRQLLSSAVGPLPDTRPCRHVTRSPMPPPLLAQSFRDRKSAYTALDCWSSNGARTPAQLRGRVRPSFCSAAGIPRSAAGGHAAAGGLRRVRRTPLVDELSVWLQGEPRTRVPSLASANLVRYTGRRTVHGLACGACCVAH